MIISPKRTRNSADRACYFGELVYQFMMNFSAVEMKPMQLNFVKETYTKLSVYFSPNK